MFGSAATGSNLVTISITSSALPAASGVPSVYVCSISRVCPFGPEGIATFRLQDLPASTSPGGKSTPSLHEHVLEARLGELPLGAGGFVVAAQRGQQFIGQLDVAQLAPGFILNVNSAPTSILNSGPAGPAASSPSFESIANLP